MPTPDQFSPVLATTTVTIGSAGSVSSEANLGGGAALVGLITPATFTGTLLYFQAGVSSGSLSPLHDKGGTRYSVSCGAGSYYLLAPADFAGIHYLKVQSAAPETGARTITFVTRPV